MPDILHRVDLKSTADNVYPALSEETGLAGWWTKNVQASPKVGAINQFRFDDRGLSDMKVIALVRSKGSVWMAPRSGSELGSLST